jgi:hypothetical protein
MNKLNLATYSLSSLPKAIVLLTIATTSVGCAVSPDGQGKPVEERTSVTGSNVTKRVPSGVTVITAETMKKTDGQIFEPRPDASADKMPK